MELELHLDDLRRAINAIFDLIERDLKIHKVSVEEDYYWEILESKELYDPTQQPSKFGIGQLYEDWEFLQSMMKHKESAVPLMFSHVAPLLKYLAEHLGPYARG